MITKDTSLYSDLFNKANNLLGYTSESRDYINNIDEYFQNLGRIREELEKQGILNDISYFMLPIDEPLFEINANTRTIKIPDEFKNGISVQGDEVAETIFFSIDRYYDTTDFYDDYIVPVIQWKYADENGPGAYHLSATTGKAVIEDLSSKTGGTIKVVFGWPVSSEVTYRAANIQFSVRFYTIVDENNKLITEWEKYSDGTLEYSFSTLNAVTKINPSLEVKMDEGNFSYHNKNHLLWKRMRNSKPADLNLQAIAPIIEYFKPEAGSIADLDESNQLTMAFKAAYPSGTVASRLNEQIYEVWRIDHEDNEEIVATGIAPSIYEDINSEDFGITHFETKDTIRNSTDVYYQKVVDENDNETYIVYDEQELIKGLFKKAQTYVVDKAGKYKVKVINAINDTNRAFNETKTFEIALPAIPTIGGANDKYNNYILRFKVDNEGVSTGEIEPVVLSLTAIDNDNGIALKYNWYRAETEDGSKVLLTTTPKDIIDYSVSQPGYYFLEAINTRNNAEAKVMSSKGIRVTYPATEPNNFNYFWGNDENYQLNIGDRDTVAVGAFTIYPEADRYDSFQYEWYRVGEDKTILSNTNTIKLNNNDIGQAYYCKVSSIFNGDRSAAVSTKQFTVV